VVLSGVQVNRRVKGNDVVAKKSTAPAAADEAFLERDYVYCGRRWTVKNELIEAVCILNTKGTLDPAGERFYNKFKRKKSVGGIYTGAKFTGGQVLGLSDARYKGDFPNEAQRLEWEAKDDDAELCARAYAQEKKSAQASLIEKTLLPLREAYTAMIRRGDMHGAHLLREAVSRALTLPPRKFEED
jgi:hypothetical protein